MQIIHPKDFMLDEFQLHTLNEIIAKQSIQKIALQYPTGGGKTIIFSSICASYTAEYGSDFKILILVHRTELLKQFATKYHKLYEKYVATIIAGEQYKYNISNVSVGMVETFHNRLEEIPFVPNLLIIDEAHRGDFLKVLQHENFSNIKVIGVTATPVFSKKGLAMKDVYEELIEGPPIEELIKIGRLVDCRIFEPENTFAKIQSLKKKWGPNGLDFDPQDLMAFFNSEKKVATIYDQWVKTLNCKRTLIFCCTIEHANIVYEYFKSKGHGHCLLITSKEQDDRKKIESYIEEYNDAVIINVDILTTGFDSPMIDSLIMARSTLSLVLYLQIMGRVLRASEGKEYATIIDLGANAHLHGSPTLNRNWGYMFQNPLAPKAPNVAPQKTCKHCGFMQSIQARKCSLCGTEFIFNTEKSTFENELEQIGYVLHGNYNVNLQTIKNSITYMKFKPFSGFHEICKSLFNKFKIEKNVEFSKQMTKKEFTYIWEEKAKKLMDLYNLQTFSKPYQIGFLKNEIFMKSFATMAAAAGFKIVEERSLETPEVSKENPNFKWKPLKPKEVDNIDLDVFF